MVALQDLCLQQASFLKVNIFILIFMALNLIKLLNLSYSTLSPFQMNWECPFSLKPWPDKLTRVQTVTLTLVWSKTLVYFWWLLYTLQPVKFSRVYRNSELSLSFSLHSQRVSTLANSCSRLAGLNSGGKNLSLASS